MMTLAPLLLATALSQNAPAPAAPAAVPPPETQIAGAVMAAPADRRSEATVLGYDAGGTLTITDVDGGNSNDQLDIEFAGGTYTITDNGGLTIDASGVRLGVSAQMRCVV